MRKELFYGCLLACSIGCSDAGDSTGTNDTPIAAGALSGLVGGEPWTFVSGDTDAFLSEGDPDYFALLYAEQVTSCGSGGSKNSLILSIPKMTGTFPFTSTRNGTFSISATQDNLVATNGRIVVEQVTATSLRGGVVMEYDTQNSVNGHFDLTICE